MLVQHDAWRPDKGTAAARLLSDWRRNLHLPAERTAGCSDDCMRHDCPREVLDGVQRELSLRHRPGQLRSVRRVHQCNELPDSHRRSSTQRSRMLVQPTGLRFHLPAERAGPGGSFRHERAGSQGPVLQEGCGRQSALRELSVLPSAPRVYFGLVSQLPLIARRHKASCMILTSSACEYP